MFRLANLLMVVALLVTAAVVYHVKYASIADAERMSHLRQAIRAERDAIAVMRAEWARRTSPLYVQGLVERHLDLQPLTVDAMSTLDDLPEKPATGGDGIGGIIEALVDEPLTTSSVGKPGAGAAATVPTGTPPAPASGGAAVLPTTSALRPASAAVRPAAPAAPKPAAASAPARVPSVPSYTAPSSAPVYAPPAPPADTNGLAPILPPGSLPAAR